MFLASSGFSSRLRSRSRQTRNCSSPTGFLYALSSGVALGIEMYSTRSPYIIVQKWSIKMPARVFCSRIPIEMAMVMAITDADPEYL